MMPRRSVSLLLFGIAAGALCFVSAAHAQTPLTTQTTDSIQQNIQSGGQTSLQQSSAQLQQSSAQAAQQDIQQATQSSSVAPANSAAANTPTPPPVVASDDTSYGGIMIHIMGLFAWLLGVAAITLDNAMYYTVVQMGSYVHGLAAVGTAWRILRDIGNIVLIFGFLAIGITTILDVKWYGGGTKMLPTLLVAAVFLNFSLFISEAVIDAGNLFATEFYTQINSGNAAPKGYSVADIHNEGVSNAIMSQLGLASIYGDALESRGNTQIFKAGNSWYIGFMGILLFLVAAFVMFSLAFILIARFVALIFLIVIAPIGFAGLAVPQLKGTADKWWGMLFKQTLVAPVLLLLLYVALAVITDANFLTGFTNAGGLTGSAASNSAANSWTAWLQGGQGVDGLASLTLSFLVAMGLLLAVTFVAQQISKFGADWATGLGSKLTIGATAATLGIAGRGTLGWGATRLANMTKNSALGRVPFVGRGIANRLDAAAKSTYDLRNTTGVKGLGGALKSSGLGFGEGVKTSYAESEKKSIESREKYAASLGLSPAEAKQQKAAEGLQKKEEARTKLSEEQLKSVQSQNTGEARELQIQHGAEARQLVETQRRAQRPVEQDLGDARSALRNAQQLETRATVSGDQAAIARARAAVAAAQADFAQKQRSYDELVAAQADERRELEENQQRVVQAQRAEHQQLVQTQREKILAHQQAAEASAKEAKALKIKPQTTYAANLTPGGPDTGFNQWINPQRYTKAAANIIKTATKDQTQKNVDTLMDLLKKSSSPPAPPAAH